uniref:Toll receptor 13 n=1 Tax=Daphnia magna TaxID=35525 RepID=A0A0P5S831_9CRUS
MAAMKRKRSAKSNNGHHLGVVETGRNCYLLCWLAIGVTLCGASFHYEAPSDCQWTLMNSSMSLSNSMSSSGGTGAGSTGHSALPIAGLGPNDVALHCRLRTINSQFDQTNFSVVPREHTASLTIECSDSLLYQSFLHPHSFSHLHHLRQLAIDYCKLGQLARGVFHGLRDLRSLAIRSHNDVWPAMNLDLSRDSLAHDIGQLERLDLSRNNILTFRNQLFCDLTNLQFLNVSHNRLADLHDLGLNFETIDSDQSASTPPSSTSVAPGYCPTPLTTVDASYNQLTALTSRGVAALRHLRILKLDHNKIQHLDDGALGPLEQLEQLDLSVNQVERIPETFLTSAAALKELNLSNNTLSVLPAGALSSQRHLEVLQLSWNRLTLSNGSLFDNLVRLVVLDLSHNQIGRIRRPLFKDLYSLQVLKLDSNAIEAVEAGSFASLSNLHTLDLSDNKLAFIESHYFNGLLVLNQLKLNGNWLVGLDGETFRNCSNLEELHLQDNRLERLPSSFQTLTLLKTLDLSHNRIRFINATSLRGLKNLHHLRLSGNQIKTIRQASLPPLGLLKSLDVSHSSLQTVERGALDGLTGLETLYLNGNNLSSLEHVVQNLPHLTRLNVSDNDLRWFDYALLPTGLQWLDLHKNQVEELGNYLRLESHLKLETLDASYNRIASIGASSLPHGLKVATLSDNQISVVEPNTFVDKANLSRVDLYGNQLVTLNLNALRLSPDVQVLPEFYLGGNPFQCDCDMEWLQRINALNNAGQYPRAMDLDSIYCRLSYGRGSRSVTPLVEATSSDFLCPYRTHCFALCHCCDFDACDCEMTCPTNCSCYHDQSWSTNVVDCSGGAEILTDIPSRIPMDATDVYLDGNNLSQLSNHAFIGKKNLRTLLLNNSAVASLHNHTFSGLKRLLVLHLDRNELTELSGYEFEPLENLRELYLQNNRIAFVHVKTFGHLRSLQVLDVSGNQLVRYDAGQLLTANPYLRSLWLADNPWSCQCDFVRPLRDWLQSTRAQIDDQDAVSCSPLGLQILIANESCPTSDGSSVLLSPYQPADWWLLMAATFSLALVILSAGICLCCCRRQLRLLLFSQCGVRMCYNHDEESADSKPFDALVIYSAKDDVLLKDTLARLERKTYQLCLQHRIADHDQDLNAAALASRRLLILLTKSFVETEWGKANVRALLRSTWQPAAAAVGVRSRRDRVIILLPEPQIVREIDADLDLHLLLKHSQVVEWNARFCWSRLLLALPPPRGVLAPADCHQPAISHPQQSTMPSAYSGIMPSAGNANGPGLGCTTATSNYTAGATASARHHHKLIHQRQLPTVPETI